MFPLMDCVTRKAQDLPRKLLSMKVPWQKYVIPEPGDIAEQLFLLEPIAPALLLSATEHK